MTASMATASKTTTFRIFAAAAAVIVVLCSCFVESEAKYSTNKRRYGVYHYRVIVDPSGHGNFTTIQKAIDSVPLNNNHWFFIDVKAGIYREKIKIPYEKPFIVLIGAGKRLTRVEWDDHFSLAQSPTFSSLADNTVVKSMTFANTYNRPHKGKNKNPRVPAVAAMIGGDKSAFYAVGFDGLQDTLWDSEGRHYFHRCTIQGAVDFIFGNGQSIYQDCVVQVLGGELEPGLTGYITAQGRTNPNDGNGFVFKDSLVFGTGMAFLGRPWRGYSRVVFFRTNLTDVVVPEGWDAWNFVGREQQLTYSEYGCFGSGSDTSRRVKWEKKLDGVALRTLSDEDFINRDNWLDQLPIPFY
ncbi:PREDICTED: probable pectinesterase 29 [Tarenaya hassleriana]|uniref:probable pectinesterase 29 n=1 Tax=Tarenaya hassleriana TaxID=28532 RepID=UPI00053C7896|nr:PREDICTED: probable pectinesterase 29 [Tarenaya hassleriana]